LCHVINAYN